MTDLLENILSKTPSHSSFSFLSPRIFEYLLPAPFLLFSLQISCCVLPQRAFGIKNHSTSPDRMLSCLCFLVSVYMPKILSSDREFHYELFFGQFICKLTPPFCLVLGAKPFFLLCHKAVQSFLACLLHFIKMP